MIGHFMVIDQLGAGAGGMVVSAYDPDLDRKVALKVLRPEVAFQDAGGRARERLLREAKAVAGMSHPNIVTVHEVGSVGDQVFVAMEYVDGGTLRDTMSLRRRGWRQVLELFVPAARGLAAAHARGLVHRDFKPANVLVGQDNRVVVTDFGLVSTTTSNEPTSPGSPEIAPFNPSLTDTGTTLGTPAYMAPEQHRGGRVDARSDQFAFCVALYEALYGSRPFEGDTLSELMLAKERGDVARPTSGADVPTWLRQIVLRGLAANPDERYEDLTKLLDDIAKHQVVRSRNWLGVVALAILIPASVITYRWLTAPPSSPSNSEARVASLRAQLADRDAQLRANQAELAALRRKQGEQEAIAALEARQAALEAELERTVDELDERIEERRRATIGRARKPAPKICGPTDPNCEYAGLPGERRGGPSLPERPETEIVRAVFRGLTPKVRRCARLPDLGRDRSYEEWVAVMNRPVSYDVSVSVRIKPHGRAIDVRVNAGDTGVASCVAMAIRRARFPVSVQGGSATFRYDLLQ